MLLSAEQLTIAYGARTLLDHVSLYLERGEKLGVIGVNGAGKSTLLRLLAGAEEPEEGSVTRDPNVRLEYLPQEPAFHGDATVLEQVFLGLSPEARQLAEYEAKTILTKLGVPQFDKPVSQLSGGQRKRVAMASALVHPCDVLMMDEPTNHLDTGMIDWLEDYLRRFTGALVMVTHDRYFLERVVNRMVEVERGKLYFYEGNYEKYLELKLERAEMAQASERKRQSILRREYQWVMRGARARGTKSRERLERYEALRDQEAPQAASELKLSALSSRLGKKTIELKKVSKAFGGQVVLKEVSCLLSRDDRIGVVGANGSGKTTLLNLIAGRLQPDSGKIDVGETVRIGYFHQENPPVDPDQRMLDYVKELGNQIETPDGMLTASQLLEKFQFPPEVQWSPIGKLSGGEKRRLFLLSVLVQAPNVLLLDEPTNDLDLQTLTILEDYLDTFPGAVVTVSHDRYFLDRVVGRTFAVGEDGAVTFCPGGYTGYLELQKQRPETPREKPKQERPAARRQLKFSYKEQREFETIEEDIARLEEQLAAGKREQERKADDYVALQQLQSDQSALEKQLEEKMERWLYLTELKEKIEEQ